GQQPADRAGQTRVDGVCGEAECNEDRPEQQDLRCGAASTRIDELREEGDEKERDLRIRGSDEETLSVRSAETSTAAGEGGRSGGRPQGTDREEEEVCGAEVVHRHERVLRRGDDGCEAERGQTHEEPRTRLNPERGSQ